MATWSGIGKDPGPQSGVHESSSSQSQREAAFWHLADRLGLGKDIPRCDLLFIDGKQYAAIELLPQAYQTIDSQKSVRNVSQLFEPYRLSGTLFKWAILDLVLGNPDRHAQNIMVDDKGNIQLIDHGSAFAGYAFDPANDEKSFIPYYLRFACPDSVNFLELSLEEKLKYMPRMTDSGNKTVYRWLQSIDSKVITEVLPLYGIDFRPELHRLGYLKSLSSQNIDLSLCKEWIVE